MEHYANYHARIIKKVQMKNKPSHSFDIKLHTCEKITSKYFKMTSSNSLILVSYILGFAALRPMLTAARPHCGPAPVSNKPAIFNLNMVIMIDNS